MPQNLVPQNLIAQKPFQAKHAREERSHEHYRQRSTDHTEYVDDGATVTRTCTTLPIRHRFGH
ncbi:hypothetical protein XBP1_110015 [Xenorhabdus bovienii str. puntauvense]|uniref:Uncharacterized protein n=1 Tax=Xenorhabdus bovienii str. puntauvense TaxID=1398201 RepID=A0A077MZF9_XENBV|nr:hypothetical protein XBFFR1_130015 [Xenorhabdus bovienii str. feltiae France]CDG91881.1 hypothetical protein XBFFL1_190015 [Xenorhabdus bovienii str. feltiae Florida]CDG95176.1 hypothetical protein XBP1_110015 [Xenorhabdus bovienii str. puntauvense]